MPARRKWTDEQLIVAVQENTTVAGVIRQLGLHGSGAYEPLKKHVKRLNLNTEHFIGQGWAKGSVGLRKSLEPLLVLGVKEVSSDGLRRRLIRDGYKSAQCEWCGLVRWRDKDAPLQLDHINGNRFDNRLENLRILCANCHAQTDTYCSKNRLWRNRYTQQT